MGNPDGLKLNSGFQDEITMHLSHLTYFLPLGAQGLV
jgi:hypothetical protein